MSIAANKCAGIRAAVVTDEYSAVKSKEHNNANVLCLGERVLGTGLAESLVDAWLQDGICRRQACPQGGARLWTWGNNSY
jgi:RpiB/LacA/LacB family sugar-phosphate isomerase